jgi:hypothetical protein
MAKKPEHESRKRKAAKAAGKLGVASIKSLGRGASKSVKLVWGNRAPIAATTVGVAKAVWGTSRSVGAHIRFDKRIKAKKAELEKLAAEQAEVEQRFKQKTDHSKNDRDTLLDSIAISGQTLIDYSQSRTVPEDIVLAYQSAFPDLAQRQSFQESIASIPDASLVGYASVLKGKLFEQRYVDWLNDGHLPDGFVASLAASANNPAWDIQVIGPDGQVADLIQAKATDSVAYVVEALQQHPHIDVVTTSEVAAQLVAQGMAAGVIDSGMSVEALDGDVYSALDPDSVALSWAPPALALGLIAFSSYRDKDLSAYRKAQNFGERSTQAYLVYLLGGAISVSTGTAMLGVVGAVGSRLFLGRGAKKAGQLDELNRTIKAARKAQKRTRSILDPGWFRIRTV